MTRKEYEKARDQLQKLWGEMVYELESFETGNDAFYESTGFHHLPSGMPMKHTTVQKKFARIAKIAAKAHALAMKTTPT